MSATSSAYAAVTTGDGRLVYLSASAKPVQPGLERALTEVLYELAKSSYVKLFGDRVRVDALRMLKARGFEVEDVVISVSYRCPRCSASVQLTPETIIYVCPYCGWAGSVFGKEVSLLAWPAGRREDVEALVRRRGCELVSAELRYVPFWVFEASVSADYTALVVYRERRVVARGSYARAYGGGPRWEVEVATRRASVSGRVAFSAVKAIPLRLGVEIYGGEKLRAWVQRAWETRPPSRIEAEEARSFAASMLAPEIGEDAARVRAEDELEDYAAAKARRDAATHVRGDVVSVKLIRLEPRVEFRGSALVFAPYWFFTYSRSGSLYSGSAAGPELSTLELELPLSNAERVARLLGALASAMAAGLAADFISRATLDPLLPLAVGGLGLLAAMKLTTSAYAPAKVG